MSTTKSFNIYNFTFTGKTPILFHFDDVIARDNLELIRKELNQKKAGKAGDDRSPAWTWQTYLYNDEKFVAMPAENIMSAIRQAAAKIILKGQTTYKSLSQTGILISTEFCDFHGPSGQVSAAQIAEMKDLSFSEMANKVQDLGFKLFVKPVKVGTAKHVRVRPRFDEWKITGQIAITDEQISYDVFKQILDLTGNYVGLCDWRPGCKTPGSYGRFDVELKKAG